MHYFLSFKCNKLYILLTSSLRNMSIYKCYLFNLAISLSRKPSLINL